MIKAKFKSRVVIPPPQKKSLLNWISLGGTEKRTHTMGAGQQHSRIRTGPKAACLGPVMGPSPHCSVMLTDPSE